MQFNTIGFLLFFLMFLIIYYLTPGKDKKWQILLGSLFFYSFFSMKQLVILILIGAASWLGEKMVERYCRKSFLILVTAILLMPLVSMKYLGLFEASLLPMGISFFTLQAIGGVIDRYQKKGASSGLGDHLTYLAFFPTVISGPILRKGSFLEELNRPKVFCYEEVRRGFYRIAIGFLEKFFLADRIGKLVNYVYSNPGEVSGAQILVAALLFGWQLYFDFAGYSHMALGVAKCFGISIMENFERPYFSVSIKEFWSRWHRSLSTWLRDYVYIPLGGSRKGKGRQYCNLLITFAVSGIWHGVGMNYLFWGFLHGVYQILEDFRKILWGNLQKVRIEKQEKKKDCGKDSQNVWRNRLGVNLCSAWKKLIVFLAVDFAWIFFRASDVKTAFFMIGKILTDFRSSTLVSDWWFEYGMGKLEYIVLFMVTLLILGFDLWEEKKGSIWIVVEKQGAALRWLIYMAVLFLMVMTYLIGLGSNASTFLYQNF